MSKNLSFRLSNNTREWVESADQRGLALRPDAPKEVWSKIISDVVRQARENSGRADAQVAWLGDLLAHGAVRKYRGQIKEYASASGFQEATLRCAKLVALRIPHKNRSLGLSWAHHTEVAKAFLDAKDIQGWLDSAEQNGWSKTELRRRIRVAKTESVPAKNIPETSTQIFQFLRELRGLDRMVKNSRHTWLHWSDEVCQLALSEIGEIIPFIDKLKARARTMRGWENVPVDAAPHGDDFY